MLVERARSDYTASDAFVLRHPLTYIFRVGFIIMGLKMMFSKQ